MNTTQQDQDRLETAIKAMLGMQRYAWEQGVAAQAMLEAGRDEWLIFLAREAVHRQQDDGRAAVMGEFLGITDPCANGEPLGEAFRRTQDPLFQKAYGRLLEWALEKAPRNRRGIIYHREEEPEFWVDSFYMLPPFLAYAGHLDEALRQIDGYWSILYQEKEGLLSHMWHDEKQAFVRRDFWGVGNGWAMAGMARVLDRLPQRRKADRQKLIGRIRGLIDRSLEHQRPDHLFFDVLDDDSTFVETNFAQMLAYTIYRGTHAGWLDAAYLDAADGIRRAAQAKVDRYGYVQGVCGAPDFARAGAATEGQAFFILMETAAAKHET